MLNLIQHLSVLLLIDIPNHNNQRYLRSIKIMKHRINFGMTETSLVSYAELDSAS